MQQLHAQNPKTAYLEDMSREIQPPLRELMGHAEYIFNQSSDAMVKYSAKMLSHVRNSLDLNDMESGHFQLHNAHFNLAAFILQIDNRIPQLVFTDVKRLHEVLSHLLNDSWKFTPKNGESLSSTLTDKLIAYWEEELNSPRPINLDKFVSSHCLCKHI